MSSELVGWWWAGGSGAALHLLEAAAASRVHGDAGCDAWGGCVLCGCSHAVCAWQAQRALLLHGRRVCEGRKSGADTAVVAASGAADSDAAAVAASGSKNLQRRSHTCTPPRTSSPHPCSPCSAMSPTNGVGLRALPGYEPPTEKPKPEPLHLPAPQNERWWFAVLAGVSSHGLSKWSQLEV